MGKLFYMAPVVAIVVLGIVLVSTIEDEGMLIPIVGMTLSAFLFTRIMEYLKLKATVSGDKEEPQDETQDRLDEIDRRLTDVQDVMIALSEKMDRMDAGEKHEKLV
ncbi:MAG: hypothetical protein HOL51_05080 [Gemmatimonadetes bacterium]|jgi:hypothetical protein|nr:hypothetical protein [Gemmatimonadota bacterium]MBT5325480.1 hypothetical protein [Gemmatimonadota bacterium]MBT5450305.1 hypothetical protein [Gemmatimonadota bacterium]MBT5804954.1 hypothetical protein [Gemmatimonadota bacterium]MBT6619128.1 hypothetical protein [Gemmatimonadota bacterium]